VFNVQEKALKMRNLAAKCFDLAAKSR